MTVDGGRLLTFIEGTDRKKILIFLETEHMEFSSKCKEHTDVLVLTFVIFVASIHFCLISATTGNLNY